MSDTTPAVVPKKSHLFRKGQSGNPKGRPPGSKNAITLVKLQVESELRAQMQGEMPAVIAEMIRQAKPTIIPESVDPNTGEITPQKIIPGDRDMLKTLAKMWVSGTKATDEDAPKEKIQIVIGKLDQVPAVNGTVYPQSKAE